MSLAQPQDRCAPRRQLSCASRDRFLGLIVGWSVLSGLSSTAVAQSITAPAQQSITHRGDDATQAFPEVVWQLNSGLDPQGYAAHWSCAPFQHSGQPSLKVNCRLQARILASLGAANWTITVPGDQTDHFGGDNTAIVAAQSFAAGDGEVGLTVTFIDSDYSKLGAGNYSVTVIGTIAAN